MTIVSRVWQWRFGALGVAAALATSELLLRAISAPYWDWWGAANVAADGTDSVVRTIKWYHEGVATAHFSAGMSRLTGNPFLPSAPVGVIVGDSYVSAVQVDDQQTMGAVVERLARAGAMPLNVRQFGLGHAAPMYVVYAPAILQRWNPAWVAVIVNSDDFEPRALTDTPRAVITADTSLDVIGPVVEPQAAHGWHIIARDVSEMLSSRSVLALETTERLSTIRHSGGAGAPSSVSEPSSGDSTVAPDSGIKMVAAASVRSLRRALGDRLVIVYVASVGAVPTTPEPEEAALLEACRAQAVPCASTHDAMVALRDARGRLARGFSNTDPGVHHHPNALGHEIIGRAVWGLVAARTAAANNDHGARHATP